jgi:subfamily B ATP-binding cassette protein MsbA
MDDFKTLFRLVKPYWQRVVLAGLISIVISGINASIAWLVKPALDDVLVKKDITLIILLPIGIFVIFILRGVFTFFHEYLMRSASQKMVMNLRNKLYSHVIHLPVSYFSSNSSGSLMSKVVNDTNALQSVVSLTIKDLFIESATIVALAGVAFWRRWDLALIAFVILPFAFVGAAKLGKRLKQISKRTQKKISMITEILQETFTGVKIIKAFGTESQEEKRFDSHSKDFYRENMRSVRVSEFVSLMMEIVAGLGIAFVIWYGGNLIVNDVITIGDFFSFLTAVFLLYTPAKRLAKVNNGIQKARAPLQRIFDVLEAETEKGGTIDKEGFDRDIQYKGVSFSYPGSRGRALDDINLTIRKGELIAIVGKSGGGKTTLINMLPGFYLPDEGHIEIDNTDIRELTLKSLRALLGIVSQDVILFNDTVLENIRYGRPGASSEQVIGAAKAAYAEEFIQAFPDAYDTLIGERGLRLSGGQRQRLSLDTASEMMIQSALEKLMENRTTIVIAHRLSTVRKANRIMVMDKGKIAETGTHEELLGRDGLYQKLYQLQFRGQEMEVR